MQKETTVTLCCILAALLCLTSALEVTPCEPGSTDAIESINVSPCEPYNTGCQLVRGTNVSFAMIVRPTQEITQLNHKVYGSIAGFDVPFSVGGLNACPKVPGGCPLQAGSQYEYRNQFIIRRAYPSISVVIKYVLLSGDTPFVCFKMESKLV